VKDLIKQHSEEVAVADAVELIKEDNSEDSDIGTKSDPNCQSLEETMEMQPPLVVWWNMVL
jgi:5,10-methylenetetrahydrofolate reductase